MTIIQTERDLIALALALLPARPTLTPAERAEAKGIKRLTDQSTISETRSAIIAGRDPLGDAFARIRPSIVRREDGATYTPAPIIQSMIAWAVRSEEHTSDLQSLMRISYAVFCLNKKTYTNNTLSRVQTKKCNNTHT